MFRATKKPLQSTALKILVLCIIFGVCMLCYSVSAIASDCSHDSSTIWKTTSQDSVSGIVYQSKYCSFCGKVLDTRVMSFQMFEGGKFLLTPEQFSERLDRMFSVLNKYYGASKYSSDFGVMDDGELICSVRDSSYSGVAGVQFTDDKTYLKKDSKDAQDISCVMAYLLSEDGAVLADVTVGVVLTCDSTLEPADAQSIVKKAMLASSEGKTYKNNGLSYAFSPLSDGYLFVVSLLNK